ncbi:DUF975 family protein [Pontiellaceae bacterium B12227]|nr:DUF975 family protein [Pontiellaceae bacterium B12227]
MNRSYSQTQPTPFMSDGTARNSYSIGWNLASVYFGPLLGVSLIFALLDLPIELLEADDGTNLLSLPFEIFVSGPIGMSTAWVFLLAARRDPFRVSDMFAVFKRNYWNAVAANLLRLILVALGFLLLIVPGIIIACRLSFVDYLIIDRNMGPLEALRESWDMTHGHGWTIFRMGLAAILIIIVGLMALVVGVFVAILWLYAASAVFYLTVSRQLDQPERHEAFID